MEERAPVKRTYRMREFAERAGATVKALRHYDRLGLLKPHRTDAGYRLYSESDLDRLERIMALKFLRVPLKQVEEVLKRGRGGLRDALRLQRTLLEHKRRVLDNAISAIQDAEDALSSGEAAESAAWKRIVEVVTMQNEIDSMRKYYNEEAWLKRWQHYERWPAPEVEGLFREISAILDEDPAGEKAQAVQRRWREVLNPNVTGDPAVQDGALAAWKDREHWPAALRDRLRELKMEEGIDFLARAMAASWKRYIASEEWKQLPERRRNPAEPWNQWIVRVQQALEEEPPGDNARAVVLRAMEL